MDEETQRYAALIKVKQARLFVLDKQAATYGIDAPPHIEMERLSLQDELDMFEVALESPARAESTDELGPAGRFLVNRQQYREVKQSMATILVKLDTFIDESQEWRTMHRSLILIIGVAVILILVVVVAIITAIVVKGLPT